MNFSDLTYKIAFSLVKNISAESATTILDKLGNDPRRFFDAAESYLHREVNLSAEIASKSYRDSLLAKAQDEEQFVTKSHITCLSYSDANYPKLLRECPDAPVMLYVLGNPDLNLLRPVAIVGTRHNTTYGENFTKNLVNDLAESVDGIGVISGLAYGTDICAHRAALQAKTPTIAVLANPMDSIYPAEHREDAIRIIREGGSIVSETPSFGAVNRFSFLQRNRIIAGIALATIVVESDRQGGSMATARLANEYNREVYAVPGRTFDQYSRGCNHLIATQNAHLIENAQSFISDMRWPTKPKNGTQQELPLVLDDDEAKIISILEQSSAINVNDLIRETGLAYPTLMDITFRMELKGLIRMLPGNCYTIIH